MAIACADETYSITKAVIESVRDAIAFFEDSNPGGAKLVVLNPDDAIALYAQDADSCEGCFAEGMFRFMGIEVLADKSVKRGDIRVSADKVGD